MITSRYLNNALNDTHVRALRLIYYDYEFLFDRTLDENKQRKCRTVNRKNIKSLAIETYKFQAGLTLPITSDPLIHGGRIRVNYVS